MSKQGDELIAVATLGKAVGISGALRLFLESDFPEQFMPGETFTSKRFGELRIKSVDFARMLITFEGYESREVARSLTNDTLYTTMGKTKTLLSLDEDEHLWIDMIGCVVMENSECLGSVVEVDRLPMADYMTIKTDAKLVEQGLPKQFLLPYQDPFILQVEMATKTIEAVGAKDILEAS